MPRKFIIEFAMAPGDVLMLTALVRDLVLTYGSEYQVDVRTNVPALWKDNPYLTPLFDDDPAVEKLNWRDTAYHSALDRSQAGERIHFARAFHHEFARSTGIHVPCLFPGGDLHLTEEEKSRPLVEGRYWIVVPGGKTDMTTKFWVQAGYQMVVDRLRPWGLRFVQEGATKKFCVHPPLKNVLNLVGMTGMRDLIRNVYHAEGVICGITFPMHLAAVFQKPCVVIAGGRETPSWEEYSDDYDAFGPQCPPVAVPHRFLHTVGRLDCCRELGCGLRRVVALDTGDRARDAKYNEKLCLKPVTAGRQLVPACMSVITPDHVVEAVMSYYEQGVLPPPMSSTPLPESRELSHV